MKIQQIPSVIKMMRITLVSTLLLGAFSQRSLALGPPPPGMTLQLYAGLTITGTVGSNYLVQYVTNTIHATNWQTLTNLTLTSSPYLWLDTSTAATGTRFYRMAVPAASNQPVVPSGMALVPAGSFLMGDNIDAENDAPTSMVTVSAFYMDTNLVSYGLWQQVTQWATANGYQFDGNAAGLGANYPVETVSWFEAAKWCNARSQKAGLTPVYYTDAGLTHVFKTGDVALYANWTVIGYRLPTEAEWEKAARGVLTGERFPWGNTIAESQANYVADPASGSTGYNYDKGPAGPNGIWNTNTTIFNSGLGNTSVVGYFPPNGYGINDMAGNVFEWCWDWYGAYGTPPLTDPHGPTSGVNRMARAGAWDDDASYARTAYRGGNTIPGWEYTDYGFRTVLPQNP